MQAKDNAKAKTKAKDPVEVAIQDALTQALDAESTIPTKLLARLIKAKVLMCRNDVLQQRAEEEAARKAEEEAAANGDDAAAAKKPDKGKAKGKKGAPATDGPGKKKSGMVKRADEKANTVDDEPEIGPDMYFYLQGMNDPALVKELTGCGAPASLVLECTASGDAEAAKEKAEKEAEPAPPPPSGSYKERVLPDVDASDNSSLLRDIAWSALELGVKGAIEPEEIFDNVAKASYGVVQQRKDFNTYQSNLTVFKIPTCPAADQVNMDHYLSLLSTIPCSSQSVAVVLDCMLEHVELAVAVEDDNTDAAGAEPESAGLFGFLAPGDAQPEPAPVVGDPVPDGAMAEGSDAHPAGDGGDTLADAAATTAGEAADPAPLSDEESKEDMQQEDAQGELAVALIPEDKTQIQPDGPTILRYGDVAAARSAHLKKRPNTITPLDRERRVYAASMGAVIGSFTDASIPSIEERAMSVQQMRHFTDLEDATVDRGLWQFQFEVMLQKAIGVECDLAEWSISEGLHKESLAQVLTDALVADNAAVHVGIDKTRAVKLALLLKSHTSLFQNTSLWGVDTATVPGFTNYLEHIAPSLPSSAPKGGIGYVVGDQLINIHGSDDSVLPPCGGQIVTSSLEYLKGASYTSRKISKNGDTLTLHMAQDGSPESFFGIMADGTNIALSGDTLKALIAKPASPDANAIITSSTEATRDCSTTAPEVLDDANAKDTAKMHDDAKSHDAKSHDAKSHGAKSHGAKSHGTKSAKSHGAKGAKSHGTKGKGAKADDLHADDAGEAESPTEPIKVLPPAPCLLDSNLQLAVGTVDGLTINVLSGGRVSMSYGADNRQSTEHFQQVAQKESSRCYYSNGTVVRWLVDGKVQLYMADGTICEKEHSGDTHWSILDMKGKQSRVEATAAGDASGDDADGNAAIPKDADCADATKAGEGVAEAVSLPSLTVDEMTDSPSNSTVLLRADLTTRVDHANGKTVVEFPDGTRITALPVEAASVAPHFTFECLGFATVQLTEDATMIKLLSGTCVDCKNTNPHSREVIVTQTTGAVMQLNEQAATGSVMHPATSNHGANNFVQSTSFSLVDLSFQTVDHMDTTYKGNATGGAAVVDSSRTVSQSLPMPRLFVIKGDGSGLELHHSQSLNDYHQVAEQSINIHLVRQPVAGDFTSKSITYLDHSNEVNDFLSAYGEANVLPEALQRCPTPYGIVQNKRKGPAVTCRQVITHDQLDKHSRKRLIENLEAFRTWKVAREKETEALEVGADTTADAVKEVTEEGLAGDELEVVNDDNAAILDRYQDAIQPPPKPTPPNLRPNIESFDDYFAGGPWAGTMEDLEIQFAQDFVPKYWASEEYVDARAQQQIRSEDGEAETVDLRESQFVTRAPSGAVDFQDPPKPEAEVMPSIKPSLLNPQKPLPPIQPMASSISVSPSMVLATKQAPLASMELINHDVAPVRFRLAETQGISLSDYSPGPVSPRLFYSCLNSIVHGWSSYDTSILCATLAACHVSNANISCPTWLRFPQIIAAPDRLFLCNFSNLKFDARLRLECMPRFPSKFPFLTWMHPR